MIAKINVMTLLGYLYAALVGAICAAAMMAAAQTPNDNAPVLRPMATLYSCDNVPPFSPEEWGEIRQLRQNCQAAQETLLLLQTWEQDPMAGVVLE